MLCPLVSATFKINTKARHCRRFVHVANNRLYTHDTITLPTTNEAMCNIRAGTARRITYTRTYVRTRKLNRDHASASIWTQYTNDPLPYATYNTIISRFVRKSTKHSRFTVNRRTVPCHAFCYDLVIVRICTVFK